jgi:hypothetical protein
VRCTLVGSRGARRVAPHTNSPWAVGCVNAFQKKSLYASNYSNKRTCSKKSLAALARVHSSCRPSCWYHRRCVAFPAMSVGLFPPVATLATYWVHFVPHAIALVRSLFPRSVRKRPGAPRHPCGRRSPPKIPARRGVFPKPTKKKVAAVVHPLCAKHSRVAQREPLARVHPSPPPARRSGDFGPRPAWLYLRPPRGDKDSDTGLPALDRSRASRRGKGRTSP